MRQTGIIGGYMQLDNLILQIIRDQRVDYIGAANLSRASQFIRNQSGEYLVKLPAAISIGIALPNAIVEMLPRRNEKAVQVSYLSHAYSIINQRLDLIASEIASSLQQKSHIAFPVPAAERIDDERLCAIFSHKLAANLSGFGWIGKNCLLITPEHGPRVRWTTVLTDAPLNVTKEPIADRCGDCTRCVDICPVKAFTGRHFNPEEPREARYIAEKCDRYFKGMESKGELEVCGMCLYICPFGMKKDTAS
jgi:epoxyqueuosine reductase